MGPTSQAMIDYLSITGHFEDFTRGVLDTRHLVYYSHSSSSAVSDDALG